jgi:ABC-type cobalamin/Fe3+-siderophores transport system ATPase subunit
MTRTSLTAFAASMRDPDPRGAHKAAREAWREFGIVVLMPEQIREMSGLERQLVEAAAVKLYGKR